MWPAVIAHRGASAHHPENTLEAFEAAAVAGADIVELDVRRSADGRLVVAHDARFRSEERGSLAIAELTLAEIERFGPWIPSLAEALELLRGRVALEVEIKNVPGEPGYEPSGAGIARDVVAAMRGCAFTDAFIASFDAACLDTVQECDGSVPTGLLVDESSDLGRALDAVDGQHLFLLPEAAALESAGGAFIDRAHGRGVRICTWTADDPVVIERLFALGADGVETNDPALGVAVRDRTLRR